MSFWKNNIHWFSVVSFDLTQLELVKCVEHDEEDDEDEDEDENEDGLEERFFG